MDLLPSATRAQILAESGIQTVPPQYVRPSFEIFQDNPPKQDIQVPLIDLAGLNIQHLRDKTTQQISSAAQNWGFFQIINHGIPESLISRVQAVGKAFFSLSREEKQVYNNDAGSGNPIGYGSKLGYSPDAKWDWGDYFYNIVWPPSRRDLTKWPQQISDFTEAMDEYGREIYKLFELLMQVLSRDLGLEDENLLNKGVGGDRKEVHFRINYYPPCPQPEMVLGLSPHSDPNALTILFDDQTLGLQIRKDGSWVNVQGIPGALVVNIADTLEIVSNGKYKSVEHRGMVQRDRSRMSFAMFCGPPRDNIISPLEELIDDSNPPLYGRKFYRDYLQEVFNKGNDGKGYVHQLKQLTMETVNRKM